MYHFHCPQEFFLNIFLILIYSVFNALSEYTYLHITFYITLYNFCWFLKYSKDFGVFFRVNHKLIFLSKILRFQKKKVIYTYNFYIFKNSYNKESDHPPKVNSRDLKIHRNHELKLYD